MATKNHSITNTRIYSDALKEIKGDVGRLSTRGLIKTPVRLPRSLVALIERRQDSELAYEEVRRAVAVALDEYCPVGKWSRGDDETGKYIQFYLIPERVMDEA
jgi:hypothetical protein